MGLGLEWGTFNQILASMDYKNDLLLDSRGRFLTGEDMAEVEGRIVAMGLKEMPRQNLVSRSYKRGISAPQNSKSSGSMRRTGISRYKIE